MPLRLVLSLLLLLPARAVATPEQERALDLLAAKHGITADSPGVAVAILEPGKAPVRKAYGLANLAARTPIASYTTFDLASLSKPITALILLLLQERGLVSLDDDVRKYLPELPVYRKGEPIRVRDLLQHTSGLPEYFDMENPPLPPSRKFWTNEDYVPAFAAQRKAFPSTFGARAKYEYCNSNYLLLAALAARVAKKPFSRLVHDEVLGPLGMTSSFVNDRPDAVVKHPRHGYVNAVGYTRAKGKMQWKPSWSAPPFGSEKMLVVGDGGLWSSIEDLERFDAALRAGRLLKPPTMKAALKPSRTRDGKQNDYGLGWDLYLEDDGSLYGFGHDGSWSGFRTSYYWHLTTNRSYIILSNRANFPTDKFGEQLIDAAEGRAPRKKK
jgi:CubicO group peptidase (beta-lactamase class C family)